MDYPHSGPGIASFVISLVAGLLMMTLLLVGVAMESQPGGLDEDSPLFIGIGLGIMAGAGLNLMACALGIAGLFQPKRTKTFAIVGTLLSGMQVVAIAGLILLGLVAGD